MILGLVCARAGSKGILHKNMLELGGNSLLEIAIAKTVRATEECVVSTDINPVAFDIRTARLRKRPKHLSGGRVSKWQVWRDALRWHDKNATSRADAIVDVDVSRPLTRVEDVKAVIEAHRANRGPVTLAVCEASKHPSFDIYRPSKWWGLRPCEGKGNIVARQQLEPVYNYGGICVVSRKALKESAGWFAAGVGYHMIPRSRSFDIDDELDWQIVQDQWERQP